MRITAMRRADRLPGRDATSGPASLRTPDRPHHADSPQPPRRRGVDDANRTTVARTREDAGPLAELLGVLDGADPMDLFAWTQAVAPPPLNAHGHIDFRTRATRQWFERWEALMRASIGLIDAGLAEAIQERGEPEQITITTAGRGYLAEMRALP
jgi:hypothetical protein